MEYAGSCAQPYTLDFYLIYVFPLCGTHATRIEFYIFEYTERKVILRSWVEVRDDKGGCDLVYICCLEHLPTYTYTGRT